MATQRALERKAILLAVLGIGSTYLSQSTLNIALPSIQRTLGAEISDVQWLVDIYVLSMAVFILLGGTLGDRYGRVRIYRIGMVIFLLGSLGAGSANSMRLLLPARVAQGVGSALMVPVGLALISATVVPERLGRAMGTWGMMTPLISAAGPFISGVLVDSLSWRAIFFLNVPVLFLGLYLARSMPESRADEVSGPLDWPGAVTLMLGLGGVLFGIIEGPRLGWNNPTIVAILAGGVLGLGAFVLVERRSPAPMLALHFFKDRVFGGINLMTLAMAPVFSVFLFLTLNYQQVQGLSATVAGLAILPTSLMFMIMSRISGGLADRIGPVRPMILGTLALASAYLLYTRPGVGDNYWTTFFPGQIIMGIGFGFTFIPQVTIAVSALPKRYSGIASGVNLAASRTGMMLGIAVLGALMAVRFTASLEERVAPLNLDAATQIALMEEASNLGATSAPAGLAPDLTRAIEEAVRWSFVDAFRGLLLVAASLMLLSLLIVLLFIPIRQGLPKEPAVEGVVEAAASSMD